MLSRVVRYVDVHNQMLEGYYWSYIEIGNPPQVCGLVACLSCSISVSTHHNAARNAQMFSVILDTGSSLTAVPGMDCTSM